MNGRVIPFAGRRCIELPMWTRAWRPNIVRRPPAARTLNMSWDSESLERLRIMIKPKMAMMISTKNRPSSSPATENIKSAWASGSDNLTVPCPGPVPRRPPFWKASMDLSTWKLSPLYLTCGSEKYAPKRPPIPAMPKRIRKRNLKPARKICVARMDVTTTVIPRSG